MKRSFFNGVLSVPCIICAVAIATLLQFKGAAAAQDKTEIQFWHAMDGQLGETVDSLVMQFNQSQGEIEVKAVYKGTYQQVMEAAMVAYRQKTPPHIVQVADIGTQSMLLSDSIVPVYRLLKHQRVAVDWDDFLKPVAGYYSKNDRLSSLPFNVSTPILYYNKDIFRKAGLGDTPPATWQEVEATSRKILASGAATCGFSTTAASWTMLENTFPWHSQPFATNQNGFTGLDTRLLINGTFGLMHIGALARWYKENIFSYGGPGGVDPRFVKGDCAMFVQTSAFIGDFKKTLTFDWGTGQLPHWGPPYAKANPSVGGASLWVMRGQPAADYRGVAQFLKFITEPGQQVRLAAATGWVPLTRTAVKTLKDDSFYAKNPDQWTAISQFITPKTTSKSRGLRLGNYIQIREAIELELVNIFTGKKTVPEGLDAAVQKGNAIIRGFYVNHAASPQGEI